ncbi:hypothetical protein D3C76_1411120 [compost metagenome]
MQVEHQVGIAGALQQQAAQAVELAARCGQLGKGRGHGLANRCHVGFAIAAQLALQARYQRFGQGWEIAVEVLAAVELESALVRGLEHLADADRVGQWHQLDHTAEPALGLEFGQAPLELDRHPHAGQFISV